MGLQKAQTGNGSSHCFAQGLSSLQPAFDNTGEQRGSDRQNGVVDEKTRIMSGNRTGMPERKKGARCMQEKIRKILAAHGSPWSG